MNKKFLFWIFLFIFLSTYNYSGNKVKILDFFLIKKIEIQGINNADKNEIFILLKKIRDKNIIFLKKNDFQDFEKKIDFVESIKIKKIYPDKILLKVSENKPIGIYLNNNGEKYTLLENRKVIYNNEKKFENLPKVVGGGALEKFSEFYSSLEQTNLDLNIVKQFSYYDINRWDLLIENGKLIKLPPENYEESVAKFLEIYEKSNFKKFKVFDFRIKNELIMK